MASLQTPADTAAAIDPRSFSGRSFGPTAWRQVEQADINAFAAITRDRQWIHVDVARAERESPFGRPIAHGTLLLALIDGFRDELFDGASVPLAFAAGWEGVRFITPVPAGARVRASLEIGTVTAVGTGWRIREHWSVELEGSERPACVAVAIGRVL